MLMTGQFNNPFYKKLVTKLVIFCSLRIIQYIDVKLILKGAAMNLIERVKAILLHPREEWQTIAGESITIQNLYKEYIIILAGIGPIASIIGMSIVGITLPFIGSFRVPLTTSIASSVLNYLMTLVGVYVFALIIKALASIFSGEKNFEQAFKLAAYSSTPAWIAGIFTIIPAISVLGILGGYSLFLLYTGLPILMKVPKEKSMGYTITVIIVAIIIFMIIGAVSHVFISYPVPHMSLPKI